MTQMRVHNPRQMNLNCRRYKLVLHWGRVYSTSEGSLDPIYFILYFQTRRSISLFHCQLHKLKLVLVRFDLIMRMDERESLQCLGPFSQVQVR